VDNENRENRRKWILTGLAVLAAIVTLAIGTRDGDSTTPVSAGSGTATTAPDTTTAPDATTTAADGDTDTDTTASAGEPLPAEIADDPIVKRLAKGRTLPFTAGPWQREEWRDAVFARLSDAAKARFDKVPYQGGFGIVIQ
jgi:hypothetical protein